jgi:hypothetical protein
MKTGIDLKAENRMKRMAGTFERRRRTFAPSQRRDSSGEDYRTALKSYRPNGKLVGRIAVSL